MSHVTLPELLPGIVGPLRAQPESAVWLNGLAETLLHGPSSLAPAEREIIATACILEMSVYFCCPAHATTAWLTRGDGRADDILTDAAGGIIDSRLRALLVIADRVRRGGLQPGQPEVSNAREHGADDRSIHDTVLIAAAFCMFHRYAEGVSRCNDADGCHIRDARRRTDRDGNSLA